MANLAIASVCNRQCAYCFSADYLGRDRNGPAFISVEAFRERLGFLARSGIAEARLLGGEPTLHPRFPELVECARLAGFKVRVFSNGLMPGAALECLAALSPDDCTVLVNVDQPEADGGRVHARQREVMRRLGERGLPAVTICRPDFGLDHILALIADTGCQPAVRLGMAQPCLSGSNEHVPVNHYRAVATRIVQFAARAGAAGVALDFDCGFVRCVFSDEDLEQLRAAGARAAWQCSPIVDVDVEGRAIYCYPLAGLGALPLGPGADAAALRAAFEARSRVYRRAGVFRECSACPLKASGECPGGCLAATIRRFRRTPFTLHVPEGSDG